jgi:hypothetical protein
MCSQNQDEVEVVKNELLKAGIASETRCHPMAESLGVRGIELWVQHEQDFFDASKLYARMQERAAGRSGGPAPNPQGKRPIVAAGPEAEPCRPAQGEVKSIASGPPKEPRREELKHARSLLEKGIEEMFMRESELARECASLRSKVEQLSKALAQAQADLDREIQGRAVAETNQTAQISGLVNALDREKQEWQQQLKRRDDSLKNAQEELDSMSRLLEAQQAAAMGLKQQVVSLELQRNEHEIALSNARAEALEERDARIAAEERAEKAVLAQESLETQLAGYKKLEQHMQAHVASLSSLFCKTEAREV